MPRNNTQRRYEETATISSGQQVSDAIDCFSTSIAGMIIPSEFSGTKITFQSSFDGVTYKDAYDVDGNKLEISVVVNSHIHLFIGDFLAAKHIKLVSNAVESAERQIKLILMGV